MPKNEVGIEGLPIRNCDANDGNELEEIAPPDAEFMPIVALLIRDVGGEGWTTLLPWLYSDAGESDLIAACWVAGAE